MKVSVADAPARVQGLVSEVKMATVLEDCITEEQRCIVRFWAEGLNVKDIHKEMFPVYGEKCLSRKAVHNLVEKFSQGHSKVGRETGSLGLGGRGLPQSFQANYRMVPQLGHCHFLPYAFQFIIHLSSYC
jgi:hypothetical protein